MDQDDAAGRIQAALHRAECARQLDVASGRKKAWADKWGLHNDLVLFNPAPIT